MDPTILIIVAGLVALCSLGLLFFFTFMGPRPLAAGPGIDGKVDASGRTLVERLDQSEASDRG